MRQDCHTTFWITGLRAVESVKNYTYKYLIFPILYIFGQSYVTYSKLHATHIKMSWQLGSWILSVQMLN